MKQIKQSLNEFSMCHEYLERKLMLSPNWLSEDIEIQIKAEKAFKKLNRDKVTFQTWCDKWLTPDQKQQLDNAIRAKKSRTNRKKGSGTKTVTLSHKAWLILSTGAKRDKVTLSEWIISNFTET